jgi:hypothetical protein
MSCTVSKLWGIINNLTHIAINFTYASKIEKLRKQATTIEPNNLIKEDDMTHN